MISAILPLTGSNDYAWNCDCDLWWRMQDTATEGKRQKMTRRPSIRTRSPKCDMICTSVYPTGTTTHHRACNCLDVDVTLVLRAGLEVEWKWAQGQLLYAPYRRPTAQCIATAPCHSVLTVQSTHTYAKGRRKNAVAAVHSFSLHCAMNIYLRRREA